MTIALSTWKKPLAKPCIEGSLSERAYQLTLDQILRGALPLGAVVSRRSLAEQFGMSFIPLNAALQRLERDGLVESQPRVGTRVKIPTPEEVRSRFEMREALECQSARLSAERSTFQERLELKRSAEQMDTLFARMDSDSADRELLFAAQRYHTELHTKIAMYARSEVLRAAIETTHILVFNWLYNTATRLGALPEGFHQSLIATIITGDPDKAEAAMREHVRYRTDKVLQSIAHVGADRWRQKR